LVSISGTARNDLWSVGWARPTPSQGPGRTLAEHWDGSTWNVVATPNASTTGNILTAVSAASATDVWAVGGYVSGGTASNPEYATVAEHYDGVSWSLVPGPALIGSELTGVSAIAPNNAWAVGYATNGSRLVTLIEHWNGSSWTVVGSPNEGAGDNVLEDLVALAPDNIWAAGYSEPVTGAGLYRVTLTLHWNGWSWSRVASPNVVLGTGLENILWGVSGSAANDVWAVGIYTRPTDGADQTLTMHWNGSAWTVVPSPNPGNPPASQNPGGHQEMLAVVSLAPNDAWAVGTWAYGLPSGSTTPIYHTMAVHWDGASWSDNRYDVAGGHYAELDDVITMGGTWGAGAMDVWTPTAIVDQPLTVTSCSPPGSPGNVAAIAGDQSATVYWSAPSAGSSPITSYTVTASPGGATISTNAPITSASVPGLTNATAYTFAVTATNAIGTGPPSAASNAVTPGRGSYQTLTPSRILDTRDGTGGFPRAPLRPGQTIKVQVAGGGGVPGSGAQAVVMNVTVTGTTAPGYLTIYPTGAPQPLASSLNWTAGKTVANLVEVALGTSGQVSVYNSGGDTHVIFDVAGYVLAPTAGAPAGSVLEPVDPIRVLDTRSGPGPLGPGETRRLLVAGLSSPHDAVVMNMTVTNPTASSYLTVWPDGAPQPTVSNLNFVAGQTVANRVQVKISADGYVDIYNAAGRVDVVADLNGRFATGIPAAGGLFVAQSPSRIADTRSDHRPLGPGITMFVQVRGVAGIPADAKAVVANITVTDTSAAGYLNLTPDGVSVAPNGVVQIRSSDLNWVAGETRANLAVVKLGSTGGIYIYNAAGSTDVIVDVLGWYG
jgi:hypothetical protein